MPPGNNIIARLKLRDRARFVKDARLAAHEIRKIGDAADDASNAGGGMMGVFKNLFDNIPQWGGRTRIFGFAVGTVVTALIAVIPLAVGLGGALVALTGSLAAAAIGAGLLATAMGGTLALGLGGIGLVLFDIGKNFATVNTRFQTWRQTVAAFGADSKQAQTALARLNGVVQTSGGPLMLEAVQAWTELRDEFSKAMTPVAGRLMEAMLGIFNAIRILLPTIVKFTTIVTDSLAPVLKSWLGALTSKDFQGALIAIAHSFAAIAGPLGQALLNIFAGMIAITVRLAPVLRIIAFAIEDVTAKFAVWAQTANFRPFLSQLGAWWGLLKSAGGLLVTLLSGGAAAGRELVWALTDVFNGWNAFLKGGEGQFKMSTFFEDAIRMTKSFAGVMAGLTSFIFKFARAAIPIYDAAFKAISSAVHQLFDALAPAKPFWDNVLWPFIKGLAIGIGATLVGAFKFIIFLIKIFATVLGWIGKRLAFAKGAFELAGKVIGFLAGGPILKLLGLLGKLNILLGPLGFLFRVLALPIRLAGWAFGFLLKMGFRMVSGLFGRLSKILPFMKSIWNAVIGFLTGPGLGGRLFDAGIKIWNWVRNGMMQAISSGLGFAIDMAKSIANAVIKLLNSAIPNSIPIPGAPDIDLPNNPIPMLAGGGVVSGVGSWITGEAGPELNTLQSGRVTVQPLPAVGVQSTNATLAPGGGHRTIVTKVYLRGKQIAEAVADEASDALAGA
jgi:hypothetical protein